MCLNGPMYVRRYLLRYIPSRSFPVHIQVAPPNDAKRTVERKKLHTSKKRLVANVNTGYAPDRILSYIAIRMYYTYIEMRGVRIIASKHNKDRKDARSRNQKGEKSEYVERSEQTNTLTSGAKARLDF